jgi:hypothetical protein
MISTIIIAIAIVFLIFGTLGFVMSFSTTLGPHCRCGHHRSAHKGAHTECSGIAAIGVNDLGIRQWRYCPCPSYRKTGESYWERIRIGTEEARR